MDHSDKLTSKDRMSSILGIDMDIFMIVGNWKMNTTVAEAEELAAGIATGLARHAGTKVVVCPPFVSLIAVREVLRNSDISIGSQNLYHESNGAYTGEVSTDMVIDICQYAIVGHSERRSIFGETDAAVNLKVKAALGAGITPILCVGENLEEREAGGAESVVESQVRSGLQGVDIGAGLVVAYEPVWAIGTGQSASPEIAQAMMAHIRQTLMAIGGLDAANGVPLLYGGSVNAENIGGYVSQPDINGALVGGASLDAESFVEIVKVAAGD